MINQNKTKVETIFFSTVKADASSLHNCPNGLNVLIYLDTPKNWESDD